MKYEVKGNPNYAAKVIRVRQLQTLEGLDNLRGVLVDGYLALVSKDTPLDSLAVVFPAEAQLSEEFAAEHNLHRDQTLNYDPEATPGYLEKHRRIKAIKLRGYVSSALLLPAWEDDMTEGLEFDTINGETISVKYEPPAKGNPNTPKTPKQDKLFGKVAYALPEHPDTAQFLREQHTIPDSKHVIVSQKLHGCFRAGTRVLMFDGTTKAIQNIRKGDSLLGYDERTGEVRESRATFDAFSTGTVDSWLKLKFEQPIKGDKPTTYSTPDHRFWTKEAGWVEAEHLKPWHTALFVRHLPAVTDMKRSVLIGLLLGDGSIAGKKKNSVEWSHKEAHREYVTYVQSLLGNLTGTGTGSLQYRTSGYGSLIVGARTKAIETVRRVTENWRNNNVPENLELDALSLAIWYMDDGSLAHSELQEDRANFAICRYSEDNARRIKNAMLRAGFENPVIYNAGGYWRMRLNRDDANMLFTRIRSFVPSVMQYKLPVKHRGYFQHPIVKDTTEPVVIETHLVDVETAPAKSTRNKWDISTETGNFVAQQIVVHNSSVRAAKVEVERERTWWQKLLRRPAQTYWAWAVGSRKVIKTVSGTGKESADHWYAEGDIWTKTLAPYEALIPNGWAIYGEIYGYAPGSSTPIQKGYTYDARPGEAKFIAYRVVNHGIDLGDAAAREWCAERGIAFVPKLWEGPKSEFVAEDWMDRRFADEVWPDAIPLAKESPVDEGIVVRVPGLVPKFFKVKSPQFFVHESSVLDTGEQDIESSR